MRAAAALSVLTTATAVTAGLAAATGLQQRLKYRDKLLPALRSPGVLLTPDVLSADQTVPALRAADARRGPTAPVDGVTVTRAQAAGPDGREVPVLLHRPRSPRPTGAVLWFHAGGHVVGSAGQDTARASALARDTGALVVAVDHRLAPEHRYPADLEDAFTTLLWLLGKADELGIDPARVAVAGASSGGGLAAATALRAHDAGIRLAFQALLYPMLDDRTGEAAARDGRGVYLWTGRMNVGAWDAYLGRPGLGDHVPALAAPARREDLSGLAPAWIGVGTLDLFFEEDLTYAARLDAAAVDVTVHVVDGMYHSAETARPDAPPMAAFTESWTGALRAALAS